MSRKRHLRVVPSPAAATPRPQNLPVGTRRRLIRDPRGWLASGFGAGFSPWAPGTVASIAAVLPWWFGLSTLPTADYLGIVALAFLVGLWAARWTIRESRVEDPPLVVWDEVVGVWLALAVVPREWPWVLAAVVLFRIFDIAKPWPVGWADRHVKGAFGTMLDDALAGLMAAGLMAIAVALAPTVSAALGAP